LPERGPAGLREFTTRVNSRVTTAMVSGPRAVVGTASW